MGERSELERRLKELSLLYEISSLLTSAVDVDELLNLIARIVVEKLGVKACSVRLLDEETGEMVLKAVYGLSREYIDKGPVVVWKSPLKDVIMKGETVYIEDASTDPRVQYPEEARKEGIKSMLCLALMINGKPIGALSVYTDRPRRFTIDEIWLLQSIANHAALAIQKARFYESLIQVERLHKELEIAAAIQERLLPKGAPEFEGIDAAGRNIPSQQVGGDYYDLIRITDDHLGIAIADVAGKSVPGAIMMASARAALRVNIENVYRVQDIITKLNRFLCADMLPYEFITLFYGVIEVSSLTLTYTNAGHNPPLIFRGDEVIELWKGGPLLGVFPDVVYEEDQIQLLPGDILVLYTDGITEAINERDEIFGEERLREVVARNRDLPAEGILDGIFKAVEEFIGGEERPDDQTAVVVKILPR